MTGPEHYLRAEALLGSCENESIRDLDDQDRVVEFYPEHDGLPHDDIHHEHDGANALAAAQVHATLALAAATAEGSDAVTRVRVIADGGTPWEQPNPWRDVLGLDT